LSTGEWEKKIEAFVSPRKGKEVNGRKLIRE